METYKNKSGDTAVLVSIGFGAGWSTWNCKDLAYDKRVVEYFLSKEENLKFLRDASELGTKESEELKDFLKSIGYEDVYTGGFKGISLFWVPKGTAFRITEYDGFENIEYLDEEDFMVF